MMSDMPTSSVAFRVPAAERPARSPDGRSVALPLFHAHDGADRLDRGGAGRTGVAAATAEALMLAGRIIMDAGVRQDTRDAWYITDEDHTGLTLLVMDVVVAEAAATRLVSLLPNGLEVG